MIQNFFDPQTLEIITRLFIALILGTIVGAERVWAHKTAGIRTYALVSMGSALFVIISDLMVQSYNSFPGLNPLHIVAQIVMGVGFLGTGLIFSNNSSSNSKIMGLTTATGFWVVAGIGMASGFGLFKLSFIATFLTLFIFVILWFFEKKFKDSSFVREDTENNQ